jgi:DNA-binding NtrC family response regulator
MCYSFDREIYYPKGYYMVAMQSNTGQINLLANQTDWAWPLAVRSLFAPRGVNLLMANSTNELVNILDNRRIHTAIIDGSSTGNAFAMIKVIRMGYPLVPCILLSNSANTELLAEALDLEVFSVLGKPVNLEILKELLNKLFVRKYNNTIFSD